MLSILSIFVMPSQWRIWKEHIDQYKDRQVHRNAYGDHFMVDEGG